MGNADGVISVPSILLPARASDPAFMRTWSVIACDQFTSDRSYWEALSLEVGDRPSTLRMIYPEAYLSEPDAPERIAAINGTMDRYMRTGLLRRLNPGFVLTERETPCVQTRRYGIVLAVDLEKYSFEKGARLPVRASEETVPGRLPPRVRIRENARLELPHVMLLYNAREEDILAGLERELAKQRTLYDFGLNRGGGHLRGWLLSGEQSARVARRLQASAEADPVFAVGDGNHSLAAAKICWENKKKSLMPVERGADPARFALCEAVSLYSDAIVFEPIYRYVTGICREEFLGALRETLPGAVTEGGMLRCREGDVARNIRAADDFIADYCAQKGGAVDYVHGERELTALVASRGDSAGIDLGTVRKEDFFASLSRNGPFPRKTFSMGEGIEKRYYTECKEI